MANLKEIRNSIASVSSTKQITSAMKMVSAAKLRKSQDAVLKMRPYANKLQEVLSEVCGNTDAAGENVLIKSREAKKVLIIVITSNRGLCGAFNSGLVKHVINYVHEKYSVQLQSNNLHFYCFGKKGYDLLNSKSYKIVGNESHIFDHLKYANVAEFAQNFIEKFSAKEYDKIEIVYNRFKNAAVQIITTEQFLPVPIQLTTNKNAKRKYYFFEPEEEEIISNLIPKTLKTQLFKAMLDSFAAEHGSRMTAMHKATDNATELLSHLKLTYNKARQATITKEILEIVSGANALKS